MRDLDVVVFVVEVCVLLGVGLGGGIFGLGV